MNPLLLQKQLKENASDLQDFYKELTAWRQDMEDKNSKQESLENDKKDHAGGKKLKKSEHGKSKSNSNKQTTKPKNKIGYTDYKAWDKFDVDAECEKIDNEDNSDSELTDECDESMRDQAYLEKEKGNKFVKQGKWREASDCYTRAIDCYSYDPIFYANRGLCFLKTGDLTKAEADCTLSLKLDKTYVKAYQRRAAARMELKKFEEARADLMEILKLEPKNKEAKENFEKLKKLHQFKEAEPVQRPVSKFTASRNTRKHVTPNVVSTISKVPTDNSKTNERNKNKELDLEKPVEYWPSGSDDIIIVKSFAKPRHSRSKKPLKRIKIVETPDSSNLSIVKKDKEVLSKGDELVETTLKTDDLKVIERKPNSYNILKETKNETNHNIVKEFEELQVPKTSVQFYSHWKYFKSLDEKSQYMKLIGANSLPLIFKESLESSVFSDILEVLAKCFIKDNEKIFEFLFFLTKIKRFSTLVMFMSDNDKTYLGKLLDYVKKNEDLSNEEIDDLYKAYEL